MPLSIRRVAAFSDCDTDDFRKRETEAGCPPEYRCGNASLVVAVAWAQGRPKMTAKRLIPEPEGTLLSLAGQIRGYTLEVGLHVLRLRGLMQEEHGQRRAPPGPETLLAFYAASIKHLFRTCSKNPLVHSAVARS